MVERKIDTKKDSAEDIRKTIDFLQKFLDAGSESTSYDDLSPTAMNIFSQDDNDDSDKVDLEDNEEEKEDMKIKPMFY